MNPTPTLAGIPSLEGHFFNMVNGIAVVEIEMLIKTYAAFRTVTIENLACEESPFDLYLR